MKKLITICIFMATAFSVNAQDGKPTKEETIAYINNIIKENEASNSGVLNFSVPGSNEADGVDGILVNLNGKVTLYNHYFGKFLIYNEKEKNPIGSFNLFDFEKLEISGSEILLLGKNNLELGGFMHLLPIYVPKLEKAFKHLRSFCVKEKDPFGE